MPNLKSRPNLARFHGDPEHQSRASNARWARFRADLPPHPATTGTERAYAAGLLDGEGSITVMRQMVRDHEALSVRVTLGNADHVMVRFLQERWGGGIHHVPPRNSWRAQWHWALGARIDVLAFLQDVRPYLLTKAPQADLTIAWLITPTPDGLIALRAGLQRLNARGLAGEALRAS